MIARSEGAVDRARAGSAQASLLRNRVAALRTARALLAAEAAPAAFSREQLAAALPPVTSLLAKCQKGQAGHAPNSPTHTRLARMIGPLQLARDLLAAALDAAP